MDGVTLETESLQTQWPAGLGSVQTFDQQEGKNWSEEQQILITARVTELSSKSLDSKPSRKDPEDIEVGSDV